MIELSQRLSNLSPAQRRLLEERLKKTPGVAEPIAVVGMACRFPGARDLDAYWRLIRDGVDATGVIPPTRWNVEALYDPTGEQTGKMSVKWAGLVDDVDQFDPMFFGISPREAARMDPQQRLLLEVAWEALEHSGLAPERMCGTATGVFIGIGGTDYSKIPSQFEDYYCHIDAHVGTGNALSIAANRLSYILDLRGPSVAIDTACSSGMVGVHLAVQSLRSRECDAALAGGVNLILSPETTIAFSKARMLSPDGRCRPFDASANGYVRGEGCGIVVLKRLTDATRDGDNVLAVLRASAANQDGRTSGITAPNGRSQQAVIQAAWSQAGLTADRVSYIEAHGTGTPLGDPIEIEALSRLFPRRSDRDLPCYVTSVKANIGHTETVSGLAGIIKVVLMMQHGEIPAQLHLEHLNPHISLEGTRLRIPAEPVAWPTDGSPRVAGVSSFGFGGTNTHVVLEESSPPKIAPPQKDRPLHVMTLSAKTGSALARMAGQYAAHLDRHADQAAADVCYSANTGRSHFNHRAAIVARDRQELKAKLLAIHAGEQPRGVKSGQVKLAQAPKVAMLFTGQGSQYVGMGRALYETQPTFRRALERCDEILREHRDRPLLSVLYPDDGEGSPLDETAYTQPALFSLEYALATLWRSWGIEPSVVLGHSIGEYVAACVAGVFGLEDALRLVAHRARLMQQLPQNGLMAVVFAPASRVQQAIAAWAAEVSIAAVNGPDNTTISGEAAAVRAVLDQFKQGGVAAQLLTVSHAFHSPLMEPMLDEFEQLAGQLHYERPQIPIASNLTGQLIQDEAPDARYWRRHIRNTVRFADGIRRIAEQGPAVMLEVGPSASLLGMGRRCLPQSEARWLPSLRKGQDDWAVLLASLADLYVLGAKVDWRGFDRDLPRRRPALPTYPFERHRYWFDERGAVRRPLGAGRGPALHPLLGSHVPSALETKLFEARLSGRSPKYLADHQLQGSPVVPAAAYLELGLAAAEQLFGTGRHALEDVSIQQAMFLPEGTSRAVQTTVSPEIGGQSSFETYSISSDTDDPQARWMMHACGRLKHADTQRADDRPKAVDFQQVHRHVIDEKTRDQFYEMMRSRGLVYGPAFQVLDGLKRSDRHALAEVRLPEAVQRELKQYHLHPALGDALFQTTACLVPLEPDGSYSPFTYMPTHVRHVRIFGELTEQMFTYGVRTSPGEVPSPETVDCDVWLVDQRGRVRVEMAGVRVQRVGRSPLGEREVDVGDWLYRVQWIVRPLQRGGDAAAGAPQAEQGGHERAADQVDAAKPRAGAAALWLILADQSGVGKQLAERLHEDGGRCVVVKPGREFRAVSEENGDADLYQIDPLDGDHFRQLLEELLGTADAGCAGVVHLWSLDIDGPRDGEELDLDAARRLGCGSALRLIQQLARQKQGAPPLWLVTRGAVCATGGAEPVCVGQSPLWGLGRVAAVEHPELGCRLVDLDPAEETSAMVGTLHEEISAPDNDEQQIAYRAGKRLAARLQPDREVLPAEGEGDGGRLTIPSGSAFRLRLGAAGSFDALRLEPLRRRGPARGQVELEVRASGLNFSDVLKAMGLYPGITDEIVPLGIECSGVVTALGEGVDRFQIGDEVMGVVPYSFASHALTAEYALVHKPKTLDDTEAATIPITFLTAYHALVKLAHLQRGERVLIHAGAGGVGLAAIQIAQHVGAEVFATAGSDRKRDYLRSLGVQHVMNSRTLEFAHQVMAITRREGVDVVLNSLPGDAIPKSLSILRAYGRFLEIGKTDIYQNRMIGLLPFQDNLSYFAIDLDRMLRQRPEYIRAMFAELMEYFERGALRPLALTVFPIEETTAAFRYMAQRKNIGKVVVSLEPRSSGAGAGPTEEQPAAALVRGDATYLITGGLGALGLRAAGWLAAQGARHLVLMSRRPPSADASRSIEAIRSSGVDVAVVQGDVADGQSLAAALSQIPEAFPPLRGVLHAAGVLADGILFDMDLPQLEQVMAPKVQGAWNLHRATRDAPLDFFVLFSSVACLLGSPGQGNYAAGNAFLDGLAAYRRARGLPATSINWGPWAETGMAARAGRDDRVQSRGLRLIPPTQGLDLLGRLLRAEATNVAVLDAQWPEMLRLLSGRVPSLLSDIAQTEPSAADTAADGAVDQQFRAELLSADLPQRQKMLSDYFADELARIMGIEPSGLDREQPLQEVGMDSLLAMELKNNLERRLAFTMPMASFLEGPSVATLAEHAARALAGEGLAEPGRVESVGPEPARTWSPLVALQSAGREPPLFCVHPLGGDIRCYVDLARRLGDDRPVYGLRGRGSDGLLPPHGTMDEMVEAYLEAMGRVQPDGPYYLAGWSAGGIYAYEMARRLRGRDVPVAILALLDTPLPSIYDYIDLTDDARFLFDFIDFVNRFSGAEMQVSYEQLRALDSDEQFRTGLREAKRQGVVPADVSEQYVRRLVDTARAHVKMIMDYELKPVDQPLHLFRPEQRGTLAEISGQTLAGDLGWSGILGDRLILHETPGEHFSMMVGQNAARLAQRLREVFQQASRSGSAR